MIRIRIEVLEVDHTGRTDRARRIDGFMVFPPASSIPGYPANPGDEQDHQWVAYEDDGHGNGDAVADSDARSLAATFGAVAEQIVKRYV